MEANFRRISSRFFLALTVLFMIIVACGQSEITPRPLPTRPETRLMVESNLDATEMWRISSLRIGSDTILVTPGHIIFYDTTYGVIDNGRLVSYDPTTGLVEWKTKYEGGATSISVDDNKLYAASPNDPLQAYDLETGSEVWSGPILAPRRGHTLRVRDGLLVDISSLIRSFNPETGELLREETIIETSPPSDYIMQIEGSELRQAKEALMRIEHNTRDTIWQVPFGDSKGLVLGFPTVSDNNILVVVTGQRNLKDLYAIDFETGQRLWKANGDFVSNAAVVDGKIYILRDDARLMVFDELTGAELGYVQFFPAETDAGIGIRWVGADDQGRIFVYFSDSEELIALKIGQQNTPISEPVNTTTPLATIQPTLTPVSNNLDVPGGIGNSVDVIGVHGNYAYLGIGPYIVSLDITHPAVPTLVSETPLPMVIRDGVIAGNIAYLALGNEGLRLFDISNPAMPIEIGSFKTPKPVHAIAINNVTLPDNTSTLAYLAGTDGEMYVVDVSQPDMPVQVGFYQIPGDANHIVNLAVDSSASSAVTAYIVVASQGVYIVDVTNPDTPNQMGFYTVPMSFDLVEEDNFVYLTDGAHGLRIIDVSNPATPIEISDYHMDEGASRVVVSENIAYVTDAQHLYLMDISNPWTPVQMGVYNIPTWSTNVLVPQDNASSKPPYAYVGTLAQGLRIVDISNPAAPTEIGFYNSPVTTISSSPPLIPTVVPDPSATPTPSDDGLICISNLCLRLYE